MSQQAGAGSRIDWSVGETLMEENILRENLSPGLSWLEGRVCYQYLDCKKKAAEAVGVYKNGSPRFKCSAIDGQVHGICRAWHENGTLQAEESYCRGLLEGERKEWHPNGVLKSRAYWKQGLLTGELCRWDENGNLISKQAHAEGRLHGKSFSWYPDGRLKREANYSSGRRNGRFTEWDQKGKVVERQNYVNDVRIPQRVQDLINRGELNARHILEIKNSAVRRICLEELGHARFLSQLEHVIIDREGDSELVRIDWHKREEPLYLVKVKCPSTGAFYALRVPPTMLSVKEAVAWTFQLDAAQYLPEEET